MRPKTLMAVLVLVFSTGGSYLPVLWGAGFFSFSSILFGSLGAVLGVWLTFKLLGY